MGAPKFEVSRKKPSIFSLKCNSFAQKSGISVQNLRLSGKIWDFWPKVHFFQQQNRDFEPQIWHFQASKYPKRKFLRQKWTWKSQNLRLQGKIQHFQPKLEIFSLKFTILASKWEFFSPNFTLLLTNWGISATNLIFIDQN